MQNGIIKGTGNSRLLKSAITEATTWEQFRAALISGTLPIDLAGINADGWQQLATLLSKGNLLSDTTAAKYFASVTGAETVDQVLSKVGNYNVGNFEDTGASNEFVFKTRIPKIRTSGDSITPIIRINGFRYGENQTIDLSLYLYIYAGEFIKAGYVNNGAFVPKTISYSFYTDAGVDYVAINIVSSTLSPWTYMHLSVIDDNVIKGSQSHTVYEGWTLSVNDTTQNASIIPQSGIVTVPENSGIARVYTTTYTGTGAYGSGNPNSIILPFAPKVVLISRIGVNSGIFNCASLTSSYQQFGYIMNGSSLSNSFAKLNDKTLSWYSGDSAEYQLNAASLYTLTAIG